MATLVEMRCTTTIERRTRILDIGGKGCKIEPMLATVVALVLAQAGPNTLTNAEKAAGWKLLFDGKSTAGWHNFKAKTVAKGWVVRDGVLICEDPHTAGDIVSDAQFEQFELSVDFNYKPGQNSGIIFHCTEEGEATWHSGPEVQIYDHAPDGSSQITGYLYELYKPKDGVHAAKPAGEWNTMRLVVTKKTSFTEINGVRYYEFDLNSKDFKDRVAKSKFADLPYFAKKQKGSIAIQGDHGNVSFRNIKIRPIK